MLKSDTPATFTIRGIPAQHVERMWRLAEPYVKRALDHSAGEIDAEDLRHSCVVRDTQLWLVGQGERIVGAAITEIVAYTRRKHCIVITIAGSHFPEWIEQIEATLAAWATAQGCDAMEAHVRKGLVPRLAPMGYKHMHSVIYKPLAQAQNVEQAIEQTRKAG